MSTTKVYQFSEIESKSANSLKEATKVRNSINGAIKVTLSLKRYYAPSFALFGFSNDMEDFTLKNILEKVSPSLRDNNETKVFRKVYDKNEEGEKIVSAAYDVEHKNGAVTKRILYRFHYELKAQNRWTPELLWELLYQSVHIDDYLTYTEEEKAKRIAAQKAEKERVKAEKQSAKKTTKKAATKKTATGCPKKEIEVSVVAA